MEMIFEVGTEQAIDKKKDIQVSRIEGREGINIHGNRFVTISEQSC